VKQSDDTDQRDNKRNDDERSALEEFQLHYEDVNKKTRATQGCSGFEKASGSATRRRRCPRRPLHRHRRRHWRRFR
jgi:hypothetical protein